jgi:hypothetical protein
MGASILSAWLWREFDRRQPMFNYMKDHPIATVVIIGVVLFIGGAVGELAEIIPQYFMWLGGGLAIVGTIVGLSDPD